MRRFAWFGCLLLGACAGIGGSADYGPWPVREVDRWSVYAGEREVGRVLLLEVSNDGASGRFYQVQNPQGQWLGYVDDQGRVWERVPFSMTERFRGIHAMEKGLALLYEERGPLRLASSADVVDAVAQRHP